MKKYNHFRILFINLAIFSSLALSLSGCFFVQCLHKVEAGSGVGAREDYNRRSSGGRNQQDNSTQSQQQRSSEDSEPLEDRNMGPQDIGREKNYEGFSRPRLNGGMNFNGTGASDLLDSENYRAGAGFYVGVDMPLSLNDQLVFTPGIQLERRSSTYEYNYGAYENPEPIGSASRSRSASSPYTSGLNLLNSMDGLERTNARTYLSVPLMLQISPISSMPRLHFFAGTQVAFLLGSKTETNSFGNSFSNKGTEGLNTLQLSLGGGAAYRLNDYLSLGFQYHHGLTPVNDTQRFDGIPRNFDRTFSLGVSYHLPVLVGSREQQ